MGTPIALSFAVALLRNARSALGTGLEIARVQGTLPSRAGTDRLIQGAGAASRAHGVQPWVKIHSSPGGSATS